MKNYFLLFTALFVLTAYELPAPYVLKNGRLIDTQDLADFSIEEHYRLGMAAIKDKNWPEAVHQFRVVTISFPDAALSRNARYFLGVSYFHAGDFDLANKNLTAYLQENEGGEHYMESFQYKLVIADKFREGAKKHLFNQEKMPKVFEDRDEAVKIYDEIIAALPSHDLAMKSLFAKGQVQREEQNFKSSRETYQTLIKKFPKTELAFQSYSEIATVLREQADCEFQNPDILQLAELNIKRFQKDFPKAQEQHKLAQENLVTMQERFALGLYETGALYERMSYPKAACIYYQEAVQQFPDTKIGQNCKIRLQSLEPYAKELTLPPS